MLSTLTLQNLYIGLYSSLPFCVSQPCVNCVELTASSLYPGSGCDVFRTRGRVCQHDGGQGKLDIIVVNFLGMSQGNTDSIIEAVISTYRSYIMVYHLEMFSLNLPSSSFVIRVNLFLFPYGLSLSLWCFSNLATYYF